MPKGNNRELVGAGGLPQSRLENMVNKQYRHAVIRYQKYLEESGHDIVSGASRYLRELTLGAAAYNQHLKAIKQAIRIAADNSDMTEAQRFKVERALGKLKSKKQHGGIKKADAVPTPEEVAKLIETAPGHLALIIRFLWESSCRISEALWTEHRHVRRSGELCYIRITGKGNKERTIRCTAELYDKIVEYFSGEKYLFDHRGAPYDRMHITTAIRRHAERTIGKRTSAHMIRHCRGTLLSERLGISKASEELGHADIRVTKRFYDHSQVDDAEFIDSLNINNSQKKN